MSKNSMIRHTPVMVKECLELLQVRRNEVYVDATIGGGGHAQAILDQGGQVIGLDQDPVAITTVSRLLHSPRLTLRLQNFAHIQNVINDLGFDQVSGILFDLGTSAFQLEDPKRGFSFQLDSPLDMRMSPEFAVTAADLINGLSKQELYLLFKKYAQEQRARPLADAIVSARQLTPITTTTQLTRICDQVYQGKRGKLHPATKVYQALRLAVNNELVTLEQTLPAALTLLKPGGRLVVISFHQGEDRIVKQFIRDHGSLCQNLTKKPLTPGQAEINANPRARSAKVRAAQKL